MVWFEAILKIFGEPNLIQELEKKMFYQKSAKTWFLSEFFRNSFGIHADFFQNSCGIHLEFFQNSFCCILPLFEKQKAVELFNNSSRNSDNNSSRNSVNNSFRNSDNDSFRNSDQNSTHKSSQLWLMWLNQVWTTFFVNQIEDKMFHIYLFSSPSLKCRVGLLRLKTNSFLYALPPPQCHTT